jgi:hypothetical protein
MVGTCALRHEPSPTVPARIEPIEHPAEPGRPEYLLRRNLARQRDGRSCGVDGALGHVSSRVFFEGDMAGFAGKGSAWKREGGIWNGYGGVAGSSWARPERFNV